MSMHTAGWLNIGVASLAENVCAWILPYSIVYVFWYVLLREAAHSWKFNPLYPAKALMGKEFKRCCSSVLICTIYDVLFRKFLTFENASNALGNPEDIWALAKQGHVVVLNAVCADWRVVIGLVLWADFHFYWAHRLLHESKWLYRNVHKVHHESNNPNPWSGLSFHPIESAIYFSSMFLPLFMPIARWHYDALKIGLIVSPLFGHIGFGHENFPWGYDHFIHHAKFNYNFSSGILPCCGIWDNLCGTGYREGSAATMKRLNGAQAQAADVKASLD